jgi:hypothetical protein
MKRYRKASERKNKLLPFGLLNQHLQQRLRLIDLAGGQG